MGSMKKSENERAGWFCIQARPKHEHIAAAHLRQIPYVQVLLPRIRFRRRAGRAVAWVTEPLFPGYLFAQFDWQVAFRQVQHAAGVRGIVHFGKNWPLIPESTVAAIRDAVGTDE